jgi:hypothetical protein
MGVIKQISLLIAAVTYPFQRLLLVFTANNHKCSQNQQSSQN